MSYDIMLVFCPIFDVKEPPLGLAYMAENLLTTGWRVCVKDLNLEFYLSSNNKQFLWESPTPYNTNSLESFEHHITYSSQKIAESGVPIVGLSVNQTNLPISVELARRIKKLNKKIVILFGGPECYIKPDRDHIPSDALDYFVVGDGEIITNNLLSSFAKGDSLENIAGVISARQNREIIYDSKIYPSQKDLTVPTFRSFEVRKYTSNSLPVIFTRGCIRQCVFCNDQSYRRPFSAADPVKLASALQFYIEEYGINTFSFHDQAINGNPQALTCFLKEVIRCRMKIKWSSNIMVRSGMDKRFFNMMKAAGCQQLYFGVESFSDKVLCRMRKGFTVEETRQVLKACNRAGIDVLINLIVGFPGEKEEDIDQTIHFLTKNRRIISRVLNLSTCFIAPKSDLEHRPEDFGIVFPKNHFSNWHSVDGSNTNNYRIALVDRIKSVLENLGIPITTVNVMQDDDAYLKLDDRLK
jgi:radical SAM superfamily enzyme YgiQ (UPF0313 family)